MTEPSPSLNDRMIGFLRLFANDCKNCLYTAYCDGCRAKVAKSILDEMTRGKTERNVERRMSLAMRMQCVIAQLKNHGGPMTSRQIVLKNCSWSLKEWTLGRMISAGLITKKRIGGKWGYLYELSETNKGCNNEQK